MLILAIKWLVYVLAVTLYLRPLATTRGMFASAVAVGLAIWLGEVAERRRIRIWVGLTGSFGCVAAAFVLSGFVLRTTMGPGASTTLYLADAAFFGLASLGVVLGLRVLANWLRIFSVLEVVFVVGAAAYTFATHRNKMIHRPRWLSDWAWSNGLDPQLFLHAVGIGTVILALVMLLRLQRVAKLLVSIAFLLLLSGLVFWLQKDIRIEPEVDTSGLALTTRENEKRKADRDKDKRDKDQEQDSKDREEGEKGGKDEKDKQGGKGGGKDGGKDGGKGGKDGKEGDKGGKGGSGGGASNDDEPFEDPGPPPNIVVPVAIAVFHDDHEPEGGIYYFRQRTLSRYNGHHLVAPTDDEYDSDVILDFPSVAPLRPKEQTQRPEFHVRVPVSMFLIADHPQPFALTSSVEVAPLENPNPRQFVAAYKAFSLALSMGYKRLVGRPSVPEGWAREKREHYLAIPDDPRYEALSEEVARELDPRFVGDDLMRALAIKRWLEKNAFYTRKERHEDAVDPAASFLFGSLRGYCVHLAHAAVYLMRSQGIAARVALGYAVDTSLRSGGSTVMILNDRAHAWPEIHIDGVGWITFDIYPEQSDEPPPRLVDTNLESVLGEIARKDPSGGKSADPDKEPFRVPWAAILLFTLAVLGAVLVLLYGVKWLRRIGALTGSGYAAHRRVYRAALDRFSDMGLPRRFGETRERHSARLSALAPSLPALTEEHLRLVLGDPEEVDTRKARALGAAVRAEVRQNMARWRRAAGLVNPVGWMFTK